MAPPTIHLRLIVVLIFLYSFAPLTARATAELLLTASDNRHGRFYTLRLHPHVLGVSDSGNSSPPNIATLYKGTVDGDTQSWVRLTRTGNKHFTGMLHANNEWFDISGSGDELTLSNVTDSVQNWRRESASAIDIVLFPPPVIENDINVPRNATRISDPSESRALKIGVVVDSLYNDFFGGNGLNNALAIINNVDGLYQAQFGLALIVESIRVYDDAESDPLRLLPADLELLIERYREIRLSDAELHADVGLVHVFSGHFNQMQAVGVGWIGTVCRQDGYNTSVSTPFTYDTLLTAHEIAHNLGALHDSDPACNGAVYAGVEHIMSTEISPITQPLFSNCSIDSVRPFRDASCLFDNIDLRLELHSLSTDSPLIKLVSVQIQNLDNARTATDVGSRTVFPINTSLQEASAGCSIDFSTLVCNHGRIEPTTSSAISVVAKVENADNGAVFSSIELTTIADANSANNTDALDIPLADGANAGNNNPTIPNGGGASTQRGSFSVLELLFWMIALRLGRSIKGVQLIRDTE